MNVPVLPVGMGYALEWYCDLRSDKPLTFLEIKAWSDLTGRRLRGFEAELLVRIDRVYWRVQRE